MADNLDTDTAVAEIPGEAVPIDTDVEGGEPAPVRLNQIVEITDVGPCKKHIKVTIAREDIDARLDEKYSLLLTENRSYVAGFRPGKAPRKIVERHYKTEVERELRGELLMASLEQLAEEQDIAPLSPPELDPTKIEVPQAGPMIYEFSVEVRPQFELPDYKGLKLRRPTHTFTDADVARERRTLLEPYGQIVPKEGGSIEIGDIITTDIVTRLDGQVLNEVAEARIRIEPKLSLKDGIAPKFGQDMVGAQAGDERKVEIQLADSVSNPNLRGKSVEATFSVKDVKTIRQPELTEDLLGQFGVTSEPAFDELIRAVLERRLEYQQRQVARQQVIAMVADKAMAELPEELLVKQARRAMQRKAIEMQSAGKTEQEIDAQLRMMQHDIVRSTTLALKEHFVLQKIAEDEKIEVNDDDVDAEIERIAAKSDESVRKVRARLEREDMLEALAAELLESKALDLILDTAEYEEFEFDPNSEEAPPRLVEAQAVPGEMNDPTAPAAE